MGKIEWYIGILFDRLRGIKPSKKDLSWLDAIKSRCDKLKQSIKSN